MKKSLVIIITAVLVLAIFTVAFVLLSPGGECGNGVKWKYNPLSKTLTVSGDGEMTNFDDMGYDPPWFEKYRQSVKKVVVKSGVTTVGDFAFDGMGIESAILPEGVTYIGKSAFAFSDISQISLPESLEIIGEGAFIRSTLSELTVPENVKSIGPWAFRHNDELVSVTVKGRLEVLETEVFALCETLEEIRLPSSLTGIEQGALNGCVALKKIIFDGTQLQWQNITVAEDNNLSETEIICNP